MNYGPVALFVSDDNALSGTFNPALGQPVRLAALCDITWNAAGGESWAQAGTPVLQSLPVVVSAEPKGFLVWFRLGGVVMVPLFAVGFLALGIILYKLWDLWMLRRAVARLAARKGEPAVLTPLVQALRDHTAAPAELREQKAHEAILGLIPRFERGLGGLSVLGASAPLLGLLGTVTGMINTFHAVTRARTTDIRILSGGISEALITTEVGLSIAIPVLLIHAWLGRRVQSRISELEAFAESAASTATDAPLRQRP